MSKIDRSLRLARNAIAGAKKGQGQIGTPMQTGRRQVSRLRVGGLRKPGNVFIQQGNNSRLIGELHECRKKPEMIRDDLRNQNLQEQEYKPEESEDLFKTTILRMQNIADAENVKVSTTIRSRHSCINGQRIQVAPGGDPQLLIDAIKFNWASNTVADLPPFKHKQSPDLLIKFLAEGYDDYNSPGFWESLHFGATLAMKMDEIIAESDRPASSLIPEIYEQIASEANVHDLDRDFQEDGVKILRKFWEHGEVLHDAWQQQQNKEASN